MSSLKHFNKTLLSLSLISIFVTGCAAPAKAPEEAANVRLQLTQLQGEPQLAMQAPLEIQEAEQAVIAAEKPEKDPLLADHKIIMAERKITMAKTLAQTRLLEMQRDELSQQRDEVRLNARTREVATARADANAARSQAQQARMQAEAAQAKAEELRMQIEELNARPTDRGLVVTLGDVLFNTGKANLKNASSSHLDKLAVFLNTYPNRTAQIEGHTDNVGSDASNMLLAQNRAETVKSYLMAQGIMGSRLEAVAKGETSPIATNETAEGRQQNRRVEVIIDDADQ
ncbi:OmpA family protein [Rheinheimera salexigens]|uniref:OmpA-like domain-containing protein n=1 Tax=Rheinheimera salexigens TaxID=1628148 RepID=A0A1E7Q9G6_9GAMM|nr:OmpA family protein [Rheinheimera salexigens]OEY70842.1 hypothetical protein BI198_15720 [Rheinheimera salexigens]